jgi:hypothetical protein
MTTDSSRYLSDLHKQIDRLFNLEEVRTLCFDLGVDFDNVAGEGKSARIRELILQLARREELQRLIDLVRQERPRAAWANVPADFNLPGGLETPEKLPPATANYYGPVTFNQQGQTIQGPQINAGGNVEIDHLGDRNIGDTITVGDISNTSGVAIGREARAEVTTTTKIGGRDPAIEELFAPLQELIMGYGPELLAKVEKLQAEAGRGVAADDAKVAGLVQDIADAAPAAGPELTALFDNLALAGPATSFVLDRLNRPAA